MLPVFLSADTLNFPDPGRADSEGLVAIGGDLSVDRLLRAYTMGIFPWYSAGTPILWWSPDPRCVLLPGDLHVSQSLRRILKRGEFTITFNQAFEQVIRQCAATPRQGQNGTWLLEEMIQAYINLHHKGFALSCEAWHEGQLAGGLYGVHIGSAFFGESMFHAVPNASKAAFAYLCEWLGANGCSMIDCQQTTRHMLGFGAQEMPRKRFLNRLRSALLDPPLQVKVLEYLLQRAGV